MAGSRRPNGISPAPPGSTSGDVGNLDVIDPRRRLSEPRGQLPLCPLHVVDVEEDAHFGATRRLHTIGHSNGLLDPVQSIPREVIGVEGLEDDSGTDLGGAMSRAAKPLDRHLSLQVRRQLGMEVAIEGIENSASERLGDPQHSVEIRLEPDVLREGEHAAIFPGEVAAEEVQSRKGQALIADGTDQLVHDMRPRRRLVEWPPELDGVEPLSRRCPRPFK